MKTVEYKHLDSSCNVDMSKPDIVSFDLGCGHKIIIYYDGLYIAAISLVNYHNDIYLSFKTVSDAFKHIKLIKLINIL